MKYSLLFLGTPQFAVPILERLHAEHIIKAVITQPDKPVGRKQILTAPPVKVKSEELGIPVLQPEKASEIPALIQQFENSESSENFRIDFLITAAYGQYLPTKVLKLPFKDALNVHPSLLPLYRGATPMQSALLNGDQKTGVSIIRMVKEMDTGPIFNQQQFPISTEWKYPELEEKCSQVGADLISSVLSNYHSLSAQDQDESKATFCSKITKQDGQVNWEEESAEQIHNKLRAFTPWPGVFTFWENQKLSLLDFKPSSNNSENKPGTVYQEDGKILIQCKEGSLNLKEVQLAGKNPAQIKEFLNGHQDFPNSVLSS